MAGEFDNNALAIRVRQVDAAGVNTGIAGNPARFQQTEAGLWMTATGASGAGVTLTLPAPAAGLSQYIAYIQAVLYASAAIAGAAAPLVVTTTNLNGGPAFTFPTALAIGQEAEQKYEGQAPLKAAAAATAVTLVAPAQAGGIWRLNVAYFVAA